MIKGRVLVILVSSCLLSCCGSDEVQMTEALKADPEQAAVCITVGSFPNRTAHDWPNELKKMRALQKVGIAREDERRWFQLTPGVIDKYKGASSGLLCVGKRAFSRIESFTPSANTANGITVSHVTAIGVISEMPDWSTDPDMRAEFPRLAEAVNGNEVKYRVVLQKTNKGWSR